MADELPEKKEEASVSASPKKILEELDKSVAASAPAPEPPVAVENVEVPVEPSPVVPVQTAENPASIPETIPEAPQPLITEAMRRLDEILSRFRGSA